MGVYLIYESPLRAGRGWRESLYRHQYFEASDCGRLGRQSAGHPWSALRVVKSCQKDCPLAEVPQKGGRSREEGRIRRRGDDSNEASLELPMKPDSALPVRRSLVS